MGDQETVSRFCEIFPALRRTAAEDPVEAAELEAAVAEVRGGHADPDALADLAIRLGHPLGTTRSHAGPPTSYVTLSGLTGSGGGIVRYECPRGTCPRSEDPSGLASAPRCNVWDTEFERVRY
jgi:hypothetical protein